MIPPPATRPIRVLLVDDEPDFLEAISFWLTSRHYEVTVATNGQQGVALVQHEPFDVVFLDIVMPRIDGLEALRRIRAFNKTLPVILVTASPGNDSQFAGARALGISGFFPKGGSLAQLSQVLDVALRMIRRSVDGAAAPAPDRGPVQRGLAAVRELFQRLTPRPR